jgi:hypothetical protein
MKDLYSNLFDIFCINIEVPHQTFNDFLSFTTHPSQLWPQVNHMMLDRLQNQSYVELYI